MFQNLFCDRLPWVKTISVISKTVQNSWTSCGVFVGSFVNVYCQRSQTKPQSKLFQSLKPRDKWSCLLFRGSLFLPNAQFMIRFIRYDAGSRSAVKLSLFVSSQWINLLYQGMAGSTMGWNRQWILCPEIHFHFVVNVFNLLRISFSSYFLIWIYWSFKSILLLYIPFYAGKIENICNLKHRLLRCNLLIGNT